MRAAVYRGTGAARDVLRVEEVARPEPGPGEVLVRVHASGVNPTDVKSRSGATARPVDEFQIPHHDGAGVIEAVGPGVDPARTGERVWVWLAAFGRRWGTAAEWTVVPARQAVPLPDGVSFELGASLGVPAVTADRCLFADGPVAGKAVLVAGGAGAVIAGTPSDAPSSNDVPPGSGTAWREGTTVYSAAVPHRLRCAASHTHTRSPTRAGSTSAPTASIAPAPSWCGIWNPSIGRAVVPPRALKSVGFTPEACTRTSTSPGPGSGRPTSSTRSTSRAAPISW